MIWSIINENDIFFSGTEAVNTVRSSNPFDYVRTGYYLDNATLFGGQNNVNYNCDISSYRTSINVRSTNI